MAPVPTRSLHLLVAEDDLASRRFLARALERLGHHADVVSDGEAALERVTSGVHYDALVLDVQMPRLDGMTVARAVRRFEAGGPRTPILALTANAMRGDRERCLEAGMDDHLAKPISIQVLDAALARLVGAPSRRSVSRSTSARSSTMLPWDPARVAMLRETPVSADRTLFAELAALYLGGIDEAVAALRAALVAGARGEARELAHRLKGSSASVGAARVGALADAIERRLSGDETIESILGSIDMLAAAVVATRESLPR